MDAFYAVDRVDGDVAILVDDEGTIVVVAVLDLPEGIDGDSVVGVDFDDEGVPDWSSAVLD